MANWITDGSSVPFGQALSNLPNVGDALIGWEQSYTFGRVAKNLTAFEADETMEELKFKGVIQPLSTNLLLVKPEGLRVWPWLNVHSDPSLQLNYDDVILYESKQYRVLAVGDYSKYGYMNYHIVEDFSGAGPTPIVVTP